MGLNGFEDVVNLRFFIWNVRFLHFVLLSMKYKQNNA